ncbi:DNA repair protein RadA [Candidatus Berkelbacteria bacterium]|nr:DNA repair protein RadA [Candidatus Berkelbacteria bacterium]
MAKTATVFVCSNCGEEFIRWQGQCSNCQQWNSLKEFTISKGIGNSDKKIGEPLQLSLLADVKQTSFERTKTGVFEFDRVFGGGIVPGSITLIGGDPGIGKSTLLLQVAEKIAGTVYLSAEESLEQIKLRAERIGLTGGFQAVAASEIGQMLDALEIEKTKLLIVDSIQTVYHPDFPSSPGSIVQVRECAMRLQQFAKSSRVPVILVGHVTKEGTVAGPRTLEHLVDLVAYLEGDPYRNFRILRCVKNRFGATDEIGVFAMTDKGLAEIKNPSSLFLSERREAPGSVVTATTSGTRPFLVEVQALTSTTAFGYPKRSANGFDVNRLNLIAAVLEQRAGIKLADQDIYINVVGGVKLKEPAADLAVAVAIASARSGKPLAKSVCVFGEIGLSGEIRKVSQASAREQEVRRLGYKLVNQARTISELIAQLFGKKLT